MSFETTIIDPDPDILKPEFIRLLDYWEEKRGERLAPAWGEFRLDDLELSVLQLGAVLDVIADPPDYIYRYWGSAKTRLQGFDLTGKSVLTLEPLIFGEKLFNEFSTVVERKKPLLFLTKLTSLSKQHDYYYLRLPLSSDNETINKIFCIGELDQKTEIVCQLY